MDPITIMITVCLLSDPTACEVKAVPVSQVGTLRQCMSEAQPHLAAWIGEHPKYHIVKWKCEFSGQDGKDI